ncbi:MAG: hypothetical protein ACSLFP_15975 [Acidimicrobiales bacterium]
MGPIARTTTLASLLLASTAAVAVTPAGAGGLPPQGPGGYGTEVVINHVSIDDVEVVEGDAGTTDLVFTVSLDSPAVRDGSLSISFGAGTTTPGVDHGVALPDPIVFLVGDESHTVTIPVFGDLADESDETLTLDLHSTSYGFEVLDGTGVGTVIDDDNNTLVAPSKGVRAPVARVAVR